MSHIIRTAGHALAILFLSLSAFTGAMAQAPAQKYGFCHGLAGNPRVNNFTQVFVLGPSSPPGAMSGFLQYLHKKYAGYTTQEVGCRTFVTAAEAETAYRKTLDDSVPHAAAWPMVEIDWIPEGGSVVSGSGLPPASVAPAAAPKPPAPAAAPAASASVRLDRWGKPIPTSAWWVCETRLNKHFYSSAPFFAGTTDGAPQEMFAQFLAYLHKNYHQGGTATCNKSASQAEAEQHTAKQNADAAGAGYQLAQVDWTYKPGVAAAPAPVAAKPAASTPATPAPAATVAKPAAPPPAKPAATADKPAVYVICRAEWNNRDSRRFYNPPVDGRGAGYAEWQPSWLDYLVKQHGFKGSNSGCGKYPTREAAQTDYDAWVAAARATPSVNGQNSPIVITNWTY